MDVTAPLPPCVLVAEEVWGSPVHAVRSLAAAGVAVHVAVAGSGCDVIGRSRGCTSCVDLGAGDADEVVDRLLAWLDATIDHPGPVPVIPLSDRLVGALHRRRADVDDRFRLLLPPAEAVPDLLDKARAFAAARRAGLSVPDHHVVRTPDDVDAALDLPLPVAVRPVAWTPWGGPSFKVLRIDDRATLARTLAAVSADGADVVVQRYVEGPDRAVEFGILWRSADRASTLIVTGRKRRQSSAGGGVMAWGETVDLPDVRAAAVAHLDATGFTGLGGIELKRDTTGTLRFIELNPRLEGIHFLAARAGIDTVLHAYAEATGTAPPPVVDQVPATAWLGPTWVEVVRSGGLRTAATAVGDRVAFAGAPRRVRAVASLRDPRPMVGLTGRLGRQAVHRLTGARR